MAVVAQTAADLAECSELAKHRSLFLKPIARMVIVVTLPSLKLPGVTVSNWEVMERLKSMVAPDQFSFLKVAKSTLELLTFDAETDSKNVLTKFIMKLDGKGIKLSGFADMLKVRAARKKVPFPKKHDWNAYFRDAKNMNENVAGERPDTVYISQMPTKWFVETDKDTKASESVVIEIFARFGDIRAIDIPNNDPYRDRINALLEAKKSKETVVGETADNVFKTFSHGSNIHFECYVQYADHTGFAACMKALRGKKLMYLMEDDKAACANIQVDFDKTSHLSDKNVKKRNRRREKLIRKDAEEEERRRKAEEERARLEEIEELEHRRKELLELKEVQDALQQKEERRKEREEKRLKKRMEKKSIMRQKKERAKKIAEMTAALEVQRKEEAMRLVTVLLDQIAKKKQEEEIIEKRKQAEMELRRQIAEKKRKLEEAKRKEEELKKKRFMELDDEEVALRKKLKRILLEKRERNKQLKREEKIKKIKQSKSSLRSVLRTSSH